VFDQVYNKIPETLARLGKVELKNIQRPVEVNRAFSFRRHRARPCVSVPCVSVHGATSAAVV
jgi:hypothetical protein